MSRSGSDRPSETTGLLTSHAIHHAWQRDFVVSASRPVPVRPLPDCPLAGKRAGSGRGSSLDSTHSRSLTSGHDFRENRLGNQKYRHRNKSCGHHSADYTIKQASSHKRTGKRQGQVFSAARPQEPPSGRRKAPPKTTRKPLHLNTLYGNRQQLTVGVQSVEWKVIQSYDSALPPGELTPRALVLATPCFGPLSAFATCLRKFSSFLFLARASLCPLCLDLLYRLAS